MDIKNGNSWERLEKVIKWSELSIHNFAMKIGMKRSENLYRIVKNKENIGIKLAMLIRDTYPQINREWLLYGTGEMEDKPFYNEAEFIPYFEQPHFEPIFNLLIPNFDAEIARRMKDEAMLDFLIKTAQKVKQRQVYNSVF